MSSPVAHGAATREPVHSGNRRVPPLRAQPSGSHPVYDVALRLGGKVRRHRLTAATKTDAIAELRALQTDYSRGEEYRSRPRPSPSGVASWTSSATCVRTWATRTRNVAEPRTVERYKS